MSTYRYLSTDLVTGAVKGDWIPLIPQSFSRVINGSGTLTGDFNLTAGSTAEQLSWMAALECRKSLLWVFQDSVPVWNGIVWDWPHQTITQGTLPISASTIDSLWGSRYITEDLTLTGDVFDVFRALTTYALSKGQGYEVANLNLGTSESGVQVSLQFAGSDLQQVNAAWSDLVAAYNFEYAFRPVLSPSGQLYTQLDLAMPSLGQPFTQSGLVYSMPGNLLDYGWTRTGSTSANVVIATGSSAAVTDASATANANVTNNWESQYPNGYDLTDLGQGYPALETTVTLNTMSITQQSQIDAYANGYLPQVTDTQLTPLLTLGNAAGAVGQAKNIVLGSWCEIILTSNLHPATANGGPGFQGQGRILSWTIYPPSAQQQESTQIQTWIPVT